MDFRILTTSEFGHRGEENEGGEDISPITPVIELAYAFQNKTTFPSNVLAFTYFIAHAMEGPQNKRRMRRWGEEITGLLFSTVTFCLSCALGRAPSCIMELVIIMDYGVVRIIRFRRPN